MPDPQYVIWTDDDIGNAQTLDSAAAALVAAGSLIEMAEQAGDTVRLVRPTEGCRILIEADLTSPTGTRKLYVTGGPVR